MLEDLVPTDYCFHHGIWCDPGSSPDCAVLHRGIVKRVNRIVKALRRVNERLARGDKMEQNLSMLKVLVQVLLAGHNSL